MRSLAAVFTFLAVLLTFSVAAAEKPILVRVEVGDRNEARTVGRIIDLDSKTGGNTLYGWATIKDIEEIEKLGHRVEVVPPEPKNTEALTMCSEPFTAPFPWDCYPTWSQFETMMQYYADAYPGIARLVNLGMSGQGDHELWALKISDNPDVEEDEPEVLYTGTMHGDELVCYPTTVHLIDYILSNYGSDDQVTRLVDETVLWLNPMSNPDGTFNTSDQTVSGSSRLLPASGLNANRSFPDPSIPDDPSSPGWATEIQHMIDLAAAESFTISANCHGGEEVFNFPWDVWFRTTPDHQWWVDVGTSYAASAHAAGPAGYFDCPQGATCVYPGVVKGTDWYQTEGNRQDFMNWYHGCREVTLELANAKDLDASLLDDHFDWNREALLGYFDQALTGIRGVVTDISNGQPVAAQVMVVGHDTVADRSWVTTDPDVGDYHRMIEAGTYNLEISADGYDPGSVSGIVVQPDSDATVVNVQLNPWPRYTVTGFVTEAGTGSPVANATVSLVGTTFDTATTDGSGAYSIPHVWEDTHTFRVEADGYAILQADLQVGPASTAHDFEIFAVSTIIDHDFEASDGGLTPSAGWAWGTDSVTGAASGARVWGTVLNDDYEDGVQWTLDTPSMAIPAADNAELRFSQWYAIEDGFDGGNIKVSVDGGGFTRVTPTPDYNDQTITAFGDTPGFTGAAGWHEVIVDLTPYAGQSVVLRWTLGSDGSLHERGWYLDDVTITAWGGDLEPPLFRDGFESGDTSGWTSVEGGGMAQVRPGPTKRVAAE